MKAMRLRQPASLDNLYLDDVEARLPGPGEVQVRIRAASLNFRDGLVVGGVFPSNDGLIPLSDAAGEVLAVGDGVDLFKPGDTVISVFHPAWSDGHIERSQLTGSPGGAVDGFACEIATRPAHHFTHAPQGLTPVECATLPCAAVTAWRALIVDGQIRPGARVLVQGTGGVSLFALQFAKAAGAEVFATSSSDDKLEKLRVLGADHVINYKTQPEWATPILERTANLGVDHVIEVGGPNTLAQSLKAARTGAHIALIGAVGGFDIDTLPFAIVQAKRLRLQGVTVGSRTDQIDMVRGIDLNALKPIIDRTFPLSALPEALRRMRSGAHMGKVCITVS
jgi:NADPH:quinone reductase-like Zn-dependent oxidoreductase